MFRSLIQRYLPRKYYAPIRRLQYGVPAHVASAVKPLVWHYYGSRPIPSSEQSATKIFVNGDAEMGYSSEIPKRIWLYWEQPEKPEIVAALCADISRKNPNHEVVFLSRDNAASYIPEYASWDESILAQHKSDLLRLHLIARFGGIWLDSSIYIRESLDWVHHWASEDSLDFVGFYNDDLESGQYPMLESWFLAAPPSHPFILRWLEYTKPLAVLGIDGCFERLVNRAECAAAAQLVPNPRVRVVYIANQAAFADRVPARMGLLRARDEAFSFAERYSSNAWELAMSWSVRPAPDKPPVLVKMTQRDRSIIMACDAAGLTHPKSLVGQVLQYYRAAGRV